MTVEIHGGVVTKTVNPDMCAIEVARFEAARHVSDAVGGFRVPKVLDWDEGGRIELERVPGIFALRDLLGRGRDDEDVLLRVGRALGHLHERMTLPAAYSALPLVDRQSGDDDEGAVVLHGDFSAMNVCWCDEAEELVILDWGPVLSGGVKVSGPRYYDLGFFVASLVRVRPWMRSLSAFHSRADALLRGYGEVAGDVDLDRLRSYVLRFTRGNVRRSVVATLRHPSPAVIGRAALHGVCHACVLHLARRWKARAL